MPTRGFEEDDYKGREGEELPEILVKSMKHCWGDGFLGVFREYFRKHAHKFEVMAQGSEEHSLEYQDLYNEYLVIFEGKLEDFLEQEGSTIHEFYNVIREHQSNQDPEVQLFINCLLASADYDSFFNVMKKEGEKSLRRKRQLEPESKVVPEESKAPGRYSSLPPRGESKQQKKRNYLDERPYK